MLEDNKIIIAGNSAVIQDKALLRRLRGSAWSSVDYRFYVIMLVSLALHSGFIITLNRMKLQPPKVMKIEEISTRFARLILEKPLPKNLPKKTAAQPADAEGQGTAVKTTEQTVEPSGEPTKIERTIAKRNVAARVAKVENKIRTVGVLGLLTGSGTTARGPAVVDVLGAGGGRKEKIQDLERALATSVGLIKTDNTEVLNQQLVTSKEVPLIGRREEIDDMLADVTSASTKDLMKSGDIIIRPPESIEGAASSNVKRDDKAIGAIVNKNRTSIKMTYTKFLKRDPNLAGKITIRFTIAASGTVTTVIILENTTGNTSFEQELIQKIRMWRFDEINEGEVSVTYPFLFKSS